VCICKAEIQDYASARTIGIHIHTHVLTHTYTHVPPPPPPTHTHAHITHTHTGKAASVLAMEVSKVDGGAVLSPFSQYPAEEETCWNACAYLENIQGVRLLLVLPHLLAAIVVDVCLNMYMQMYINIYIYVCTRTHTREIERSRERENAVAVE